MHSGVGTQYGVIFDPDVSGESAEAGDDAVGTDGTVVSNVRTVHDEIVISKTGAAATERSTHMDRDVLTNHVFLADFESCGLTLKVLVLGLAADAGEGKDPRPFTDPGSTLYDGVARDPDSGQELHLGPHPGVVAHLHIRGELRARFDRRRGVYLGHEPISPSG